MDYKNTLLLPKTDFPMRAELPKREPAMLAKWREEKIYDQILKARKGAPFFVLHDGPPFANGDAHMGHALNMVLKDIVLKYQNMSGHYAPFVPGWDCHGLPIEHKVMKELGATETDPIKIREKCEATARHFIGVQSEQFQRLGVFGDWENPYLTLDPAYEAETLRVFATLVEKGLVYQGLRPVLWSTGCQTALAEAEIEYKEKVDPAIYVKFPLTADAAKRFPINKPAIIVKDLAAKLGLKPYQLIHELMQLDVFVSANSTIDEDIAQKVCTKLKFDSQHVITPDLSNHSQESEDVSLLIWTTTPWTLPANLAVAVAPDLDYSLWRLSNGTRVILAESPAIVTTFRFLDQGAKREKKSAWKGADLVGLTYTHPFLNDGRTRQIFAADFVTADAGTGLVHIAPGHGHDDYQLGQQHGLEILAPVDDRGCLTAECGVPELVGQYVFKANPLIIELLKSKNALFAQEDYKHDYPHCWRSKTPIVFRAVKQWFIKVDAFRADALTAIDGVKWIPENGRNRIRGAVESRPDWCISRQRTWGIPLPVFYGEGEQPLLSEKTIRKFADLVEKRGAGIWFSRSADELAKDLGLPLGLRKGRDTLDVWIDSGTSWAAVVNKRDELKPAPADLYLEGSDQHRGWFQSSLLTSVAANGQAPYKAVLTNGFVVDIEGKKLSKSDTGYQKPVDLMTLVNEHGADVLRLWVASQDYQDDIPFSHDIFARVADTYRSIRNTLRILLGNLSDFDPKENTISRENWTELDRYIDWRFKDIAAFCMQEYKLYSFSSVYHSINRFCAVELSALYVDVLKDRMYCDAKNGTQRRAAQTVMYFVFEGLIKLLAPLIPFTCDEAWRFYNHSHSIHVSLLPENVNRPENDAFAQRWHDFLDLRLRVNARIEEARRNKTIGKSLETYIEISSLALPKQSIAPGLLEELFIVSKVIIKPTEGEETITVTPAAEHGMKKCVRCWKYYDKLGSHQDHPELCERCTNVVIDLKF